MSLFENPPLFLSRIHIFNQTIETFICLEEPSDAEAETCSILIVVVILANYVVISAVLVDNGIPILFTSSVKGVISFGNSVNKLFV